MAKNRRVSPFFFAHPENKLVVLTAPPCNDGDFVNIF